MNRVHQSPAPEASLRRVGARPVAIELALLTGAGVALCVASVVLSLDSSALLTWLSKIVAQSHPAVAGQAVLNTISEIVDVLRIGVLAILLGRLLLPLLRPHSKRMATGEEATPPSRATFSPVLAGVLRVAAHPLVLCALALALFYYTSRLYNELFTDEGLWYYVAFAWLKYHLPPYTGTVENKTPGIFYLFALSYRLWGINYWFPRLLGVVASTVTCAAIYQIGRLLFDRLAGRIALLIFTMFMASALLDGNFTAMPETFMICCSTLAILALLLAGRTARFRVYLALMLLTGVLLGAAIAFKQIAVTTAVAVVIWRLLTPSPHARGGAAVLRDLLLLAGGILLTTLLSLLPLLCSHVSVLAYLRGAWLILLAHGSASGAASLSVRLNLAQQLYTVAEIQLLLLLFAAFLLLKTPLTKQHVPFWGMVVWVVLDSLGVNSAGSYFGHQLRQFLPAFAVMSGVAFSLLLREAQQRERLPRWSAAALLLFIICLWCPLNFITLFGQHEQAVHGTAQLGRWIKAHSAPSDAVYIFGGREGCGNIVLACTERRAPTRYFDQYQYFLPGAERNIQRALSAQPPKYLVIPDDNTIWLGLQYYLPVPDWTKQLLQQAYVFRFVAPVNGHAGYRVYEHR